MLLVSEGDGVNSLTLQATNEDSAIDLLIKSSIDLLSISKLIHLVSLVDQLHRVESSVCWEVVAAVVPVTSFWAYTQKVTDGRMMWDLLTIYLSSIGIWSLKGLADHRIEGFQKHRYVVEGCDCVGYYVFESFDWILSLTGFVHKVGIHAAGHSWVLESSSGDHSLDGERYSGEVEISCDDLLANNFDHFFTNRSYFIDLYLVVADLSSFVVSSLMAMSFVVGEKSRYLDAYLKAVMIYLASWGEGEMNPS